LAQLAFKLGYTEIGERIVRMGLDGPELGVEYYFVAANAARRAGDFAGTRSLVGEAVERMCKQSTVNDDDAKRLLHLIRLGMATLVFDEKDPFADEAFVEGLRRDLPTLDLVYEGDAFYRTLLAQTLWFSDIVASEKEWDRAVEMDATELAWNARGTWYKDADRNLDDAEDAYRAGLLVHQDSSLLQHNLAQVLVARAGEAEIDPGLARKLGAEADALCRRALRGDTPRGLRRHIHETMEQIDKLMDQVRQAAPAPSPASEEAPRRRRQRSDDGGRRRPKRVREPEPTRLAEVGEVLRGKVVSIPRYGAFVAVPEIGTGLLHKTEMYGHDFDDPADILAVGDEIEVKVIEVVPSEGSRPRISLSQRALGDEA